MSPATLLTDDLDALMADLSLAQQLGFFDEDGARPRESDASDRPSH